MDKLLELFNKYKFEYNLAIEIGYTKVLDWYIEIKKEIMHNIYNYFGNKIVI